MQIYTKSIKKALETTFKLLGRKLKTKPTIVAFTDTLSESHMAPKMEVEEQY